MTVQQINTLDILTELARPYLDIPLHITSSHRFTITSEMTSCSSLSDSIRDVAMDMESQAQKGAALDCQHQEEGDSFPKKGGEPAAAILPSSVPSQCQGYPSSWSRQRNITWP